jgi:dTDP-4-dehydrorhamnose 3,5-epimerase
LYLKTKYAMNFVKTALKDVWVMEPQCFGDERGYFMESYKQAEFNAAIARDVNFVQDNESKSRRGVLRGLHFQRGEAAQAKLVRVSEGCVVDVVVDLRKSSPTFRQVLAVELSEQNHKQLFVPRGFAHGFIVLSETARFQYKVDNVYNPQSEVTLRFDDKDLNIAWHEFGVDASEFVLSPKDLAGKTLAELEAEYLLFS